ncbi:MAG TPA: MlaD family protein [Methylovirgula sp.]|nr:MlaD family protein [Methylovirgula sp.]
METRANYALIGAFTLAVLAVGFIFVYWLQGTNHSSAGTNTYKVIFSGSIAGLGGGSWVTFNGVRVGEVKEIDLMPQDPARVYALINVEGRVPVRTDTKARLASSGLTGVASVALQGGSVNAPALGKAEDGGPGVIIAERSDFQDVMEAARHIAGQASDLLDKTNKLVDNNSGPLTASVKNAEKFSDALAANSDGIKQFIAAVTQVGQSIGPLSEKLSKLADDTDAVVKAVDPEQVKSTLKDVADLSAKLDAAAGKIDGVLTNLNGFLATGDSKGAFGEIAAAAKSIHTLADNLDLRTKELTANLNHFTGSGLKQYEALAVDGRKTLQDIDEAVRSIEANPQQFIFGKKQDVPEYSSRAEPDPKLR